MPPQLFEDMGDGDLADSASVMASADLEAAIQNDRGAAPVEDAAGWRAQKNGTEEIAYRLAGSAANGLVAIITRYSGGGSGVFFNLHVVDIHAVKALDADGHRQDRMVSYLNLNRKAEAEADSAAEKRLIASMPPSARFAKRLVGEWE